MSYMTYYVHVIKVSVIGVINVSHNITHSTKADMLTYMFYLNTPFSPNQLTTLAFHMQMPILMIMGYIIGIHGKKEFHKFGLD